VSTATLTVAERVRGARDRWCDRGTRGEWAGCALGHRQESRRCEDMFRRATPRGSATHPARRTG